MHGHSLSVGCISLCRAMNCTREQSSLGVEKIFDFRLGEKESCFGDKIVLCLTTRCGDFYNKDICKQLYYAKIKF